MYDQAEESWAAQLRDAFASYLGRQVDLRTTAAALRRYGSPERLRNHHMTMQDAAKFLGLSPEKLAQLAHREALFLIPPSGAGAPSLLRADLVYSLRERRAATLLKQEATAMLGLKQEVVRELLARGILGTAKETERLTEQRLVLRSDVEELLRRTRESLETAPVRGKLVTMTYGVAGKKDVVGVLQAILNGRLHARRVRPGHLDLRAFLFDSRDLEELFEAPPKTLTLIEAGLRLKVDTMNVRTWAEEGHLATIRRSLSMERGRRVTEADLSAFRVEFVTGTEVGESAGTTGRWAAERLAFLGHLSVSASTTKLYRREEVTPEVIEALKPRCSSGRAHAASEAFEVADRVGADVGAHLGMTLRRAWNGFADAASDTYVQVVCGRRQRFRSRYVFRFNTAMRERLTRARNGWLALALIDLDSYLLLPWSETREFVGPDDASRHHIQLPVDVRGLVELPDLRRRQRWLARSGQSTVADVEEGARQLSSFAGARP